jgi:hypothetical protein
MNLTRLAAVCLVLTAALTAAPAPAQAAPAAGRVWFHPGGDRFTPSMIWSFDNSSHTGWKRGYLPSPTGWPVQSQTTFTYEKSGPAFTLSVLPYGTTDRITELGYSASQDILTVDNGGYTEKWYGCDSAGRPFYAQAAC